MTRMHVLLQAAAVCVLMACGGNDEPDVPPNAPGMATVGAAGGSVRTDDGAEVSFPAKALAGNLTVRIAKDGTGAPPLPESVTPAGAVYAVTPHGGDFAAHVEVTIPVERRDLDANEQLLLVSANPGDTGWRVLSAATYSNGKLRAPVMKFSYFQAVILRDRIAPQLTISIDDKNNFGTDGARLIAPNEVLQYRQGFENLERPTVDFTARLRYPAGRAIAAVSGLGTPARACMPANLDSTGAAFRFMREGTIFQPAVRSGQMLYTASTYPRTESEFNWRYLQKTSNRTAAYHFYGQDNPRVAGFGSEGIALPPAGNVLDDDLYTWRGVSTLGPSLNGRWRVDVTVPTDCGLFIEAAPLSFVLNLLPSRGGGFLYALQELATGVQGTEHRFYFFDDTEQTDLVRLEYSSSATNWEGRVAPAQLRVEGPYESGRLLSATLNDLPLSAAGFYRGYTCPAGQSSPCTLTRPFELRVVPDQPRIVEQPLASWIARVGEDVSIQARIETRLSPQIRWQRRNLVLATFGLAGWEDMPQSQQTHTPVIVAGPDYVDRTVGWTTRLALRATPADHAMQYRAVIDTPYWGLTSTPTLLTVVDELAAPQITAQPASQNVLVGSTTVFVATVSGTAPLSYQWRRNGVDITGANTPTLTLSNVTALNNGNYTLVVTNRAGAVTSDAAALVVTLGTPVALPPQITAPPASVTVPAGVAAGFAVSVSGTGPYTYQWYLDGQAITSNATGPNYTINTVSSANAGQYTVRVTNGVASVLSAPATLTVTPPAGSGTPTPPALVADPISLSLPAGVGATFAVAATGTAPFAYQWRRNGTAIAGATGAVLHIPAVAGVDAGQYSIVVTNSAGSVTSASAGLTVTPATPTATAPAIAAGPASITVQLGSAANFAAAVTGTGPFSYTWRKNGTPIPGATGAAYSIAAAAASDAGAYSVRVSNAQGSVDSAAATLTVAPLPVPPFSAPSIVTAPAALAVLPGTGATFAVAVTGTAPLAYQWKRNGVSIGGATGPVLHIANVSTNDGGDYTVEVMNAAGTAASASVPLIVIGAPTITQQPNAQSVAEGGTATFSVGAAAPSLRYLWTRDGIAIPGANGASYTTPALALSDSGAKFAVVVYNGAGIVFSAPVMLTVTPAPAAQSWASPLTVAPAVDSDAAAAGIDGARNAHALWIKYEGGRGRVNASRGSVAGAWQTGAQIDALLPSNADSYDPQLAVASSGTAMAVWGYGLRGTVEFHVAAARFNGSSWSAAETIDVLPGQSSGFRVAIDANGRAIAIWRQFNGTRRAIYARFHDGSAWSAPQLVDGGSNNGDPELAVDAQGRGWIAMTDAGIVKAARVNTAAGSIGEPVVVATGRSMYNIRVGADAGGGAVLAWVEDIPSGGYDLRASRFASNVWAAAETLAVDVPFNQDVGLAAGGSGQGVVAWVGEDSVGNDAVFTRVLSGGTWASAVQASPLGADNPLAVQVIMNAAGRIVLHWAQGDSTGNFQQAWAQVYDGTWGTAQALQTSTDSMRDQYLPIAVRSVALASDGSALVLWTESAATAVLRGSFYR